MKVMEDILRDGITEDELLRSKTNLVNKLAMSYENTHTIAPYINSLHYTYKYKTHSPTANLKHLASLHPLDVPRHASSEVNGAKD